MHIQGVMVKDLKKDTLLYAGTLTVKITDWFFFKDKAVLHDVSLSNTVVNLNRSDSVWNYQFLADYFSNPKPSGTPPGKGLEIDLKQLHINNLQFNQIDKWVGKDLRISVKTADLAADTVDFNRSVILLKDLRLDKPVFFERNYTGKRPPRTGVTVQAGKTDSTASPLQHKPGWLVKARHITVSDGSFLNEKETLRLPYTDRFDGQHLHFSGINATLDSVVYQNGNLTTQLVLAAKERSGLDIKQLKAAVTFTPSKMEFDNLDLQVNSSRLKNYYSMSYKDFDDDMSDFIHAVKLKGIFKDSKVSSDDIAIFAPALRSWKRVFELNGEVNGTIDNFSARKMTLKSGNTFIDGDIALRGLPDIKDTYINYSGNTLRTSFADIVTIVPSLKDLRQPDLNKLGLITFNGNYTGFINDFVTFGTFNTALGTVKTDVRISLPENAPPSYEGTISTTGFNLRQFTENEQLGNVIFNGKVKGSGFTAKTLKAGFDGRFDRLDFNGYSYKNILLNGDFSNRLFTGTASMNDPNLQVNSLQGTIDLNGEPAFNFAADLGKASFRELGLSKDNFVLGGRFNLNFTGNNIDNFLGSARITNATLFNNNTRLSFDSLILQSAIVNNKKKLTLQSNEVDASITGRFKILQLPDAFKKLLNKYYPAYIKPPVRPVTDQEFDFAIQTKKIAAYLRLADPKLEGFDDAQITGNLHLANNELNLQADVPEMSYDGKILKGIRLTGTGTSDTLTTRINVGDIRINDSLHFPGAVVSIKSHNDLSDVSIKTSASKTINSAELNASVKTLNDGVNIHFFPSSLIINDKRWNLEKDGELTLRKSVLDASNIKFVQGEQEIEIATELPDEGEKPNLVATLRRVNLNDFAPLLTQKPRLEGIIDGQVIVKDPLGKPDFILKETSVKNLRVDNGLIGNVKLNVDYNFKNGIVTFNGGNTDAENDFSFEGTYNTKDSTNNNQLNTALTARRINLNLLQPYLGGIFSNIQGMATGNIRLNGGGKNFYATGPIRITNASLKVNYTQCKYNFTDAAIEFGNGKIDFGNIVLRDTLNNTGSLSGILYHDFFQNFSFEDIIFESKRMLLLNTNRRDNNQFYGKIIGNAAMVLNGPVADMKMTIDGGPSRNESDSNHIYLPGGSGRESGTIDYIDFIKFGTEMENQLKTKEGSSLTVNMGITANPACKVDVILDEVTGDVIKGWGNGDLIIKVGSREPLDIRGRFDITGGSYEFNFQTFLKRPFKLSKGYINWTGNPYEAEINIDALYEATKVDLGNLSQDLKQKVDINLVSHLTNKLNKPIINFEFMIAPDMVVYNEFLVRKRLEDFKKDPTEMNKQVSSILIFNSFINTEQGFFGGNNPYNFAAGTVGQVVSVFLTNTFSRFLQRTLNDPNIISYFDITPSFDLRSSVNQVQAAARFGLIKSYFNGRLIITIGGSLDYNNPYLLQQSGRNNLLVTPDFSAEWLLSPDGRVRVVGFRRTSIDQVLGQRNRQGISLSYKKDFDIFPKQLFSRDTDRPRKKRKAKQTATASPANKPEQP